MHPFRPSLLAALALVAGCGAGCGSAVTLPGGIEGPRREEPSAPAPPQPAAAAAAVIARANDERRRESLDTLRTSAALMRAAELHARQMAEAGRLEHELPEARYPTLPARMAGAGYEWSAIAENIAHGYSTPAAAVTGWMLSSGHRANILGRPYVETGAAVAPGRDGRLYWVQVFAAPR